MVRPALILPNLARGAGRGEVPAGRSIHPIRRTGTEVMPSMEAVKGSAMPDLQEKSFPAISRMRYECPYLLSIDTCSLSDFKEVWTGYATLGEVLSRLVLITQRAAPRFGITGNAPQRVSGIATTYGSRAYRPPGPSY